MNNTAPTPDRLREVLEALAKYHTHILQKATLNTQAPAELENIEVMLESIGQDLLQRWHANTFSVQEDTDEPELQECIQVVVKNLKPWNAQMSVLVPYWIRRMFLDAPFAISTRHIDRLYKNSQYNAENDGNTESSS